MKKKLIIVGGANGVGKTTFAHQYREDYGIQYIGADEIAAELSQTYSGNVEVKAGREFFRRLEEIRSAGKSVIIESTLSGLSLVAKINDFRSEGYSIHLIYVFLDSLPLCQKRVELRVRKGGHNVPPEDIERRLYRSVNNFRKTYSLLSDKWQLLYNGHKRPIEVAICEHEETMILDEEYYRIFMEIKK